MRVFDGPAIHRALSATLVVAGIVLVAMMIRVESEPGALPLLLVAVGAAWHIVARWRSRAPRR